MAGELKFVTGCTECKRMQIWNYERNALYTHVLLKLVFLMTTWEKHSPHGHVDWLGTLGDDNHLVSFYEVEWHRLMNPDKSCGLLLMFTCRLGKWSQRDFFWEKNGKTKYQLGVLTVLFCSVLFLSLIQNWHKDVIILFSISLIFYWPNIH